MSGSTEPSSVWRIPAWRVPFPVSAVSVLCTVLYDLTLILWLGSVVTAGRSWGPAVVSAVGICAGIPVLAVGPLSGVVVDRVDRRVVLWGSSLVEALASGSVAVLVGVWRQLPVTVVVAWVLVAVVVLNSAAQFFSQARMVMISKTIPPTLQTSAFSILGSVSSLTQIIGPPLAAPLLFSAGPEWALGLNAASFVASAIALGRVRWDSTPSAHASGQSFSASLGEGISTIGSNRLLRAMLTAITMTSLVLGVTEVLELYFVSESLARPATMLGVLMMCLAVGTLAGASSASAVARRWSMAQVFLLGLALVGLLLVCLSRMTNFRAACVIEFMMAVPIGIVNTLFMPMMMKAVDQTLIGRVSGVFNVLPTAANLVSMGIAGVLVTTVLRGFHGHLLGMTFHPVDLIYTVSGLLLLLVAAFVRTPLLHAEQSA